MLEEIFSVDTASRMIRDSFIILLFFSATAPLCPLLLRHETILTWADSSCSIDRHFTKKEFCEMGPFGTHLWSFCFPMHGRFTTEWSYSIGLGAQLRPPHDVFLPALCCTSRCRTDALRVWFYSLPPALLFLPWHKNPAAGVLQRHQFGWNRF